MIAVDTNVLVRMVTNDDERQTASATALLENDEIEISATVLMEMEWVLRRNYGRTRHEIQSAIGMFFIMKNVTIVERKPAELALSWFGEGLDFADALHLASIRHAVRFATFDEQFRKRATRAQTAIEMVDPDKPG